MAWLASVTEKALSATATAIERDTCSPATPFTNCFCRNEIFFTITWMA
jgi:hypothetical protein